MNPSKLTPEEFQNMGLFFKDLLAEHPFIKASIVAAGVGGLVELLHTIWLALRFLLKF